MRRNLLAVASLFLVVAAPASDLAAQRRIVPFLGGGLASGVGDLSDGTDMGYLIFGGLDWAIASKPGLAIGVTASYTHIPYASDYNDATNIPALFGEIGYLFGATSPSKVKPYVRAGLGFLQHNYDSGDLNLEEDSETQAAFSAGAGLNFIMRAVSLFAGAHLINGFDDTSFIAFYGGVGFSGSNAPSGLRTRR
jgi:hypothetical protein